MCKIYQISLENKLNVGTFSGRLKPDSSWLREKVSASGIIFCGSLV
jgi:hypothetical protein